MKGSCRGSLGPAACCEQRLLAGKEDGLPSRRLPSHLARQALPQRPGRVPERGLAARPAVIGRGRQPRHATLRALLGTAHRLFPPPSSRRPTGLKRGARARTNTAR